jgi:hypothetical protein
MKPGPALLINRPNDAYELEADWVAWHLAAEPTQKVAWSLSSAGVPSRGEGAAAAGVAPPIVHDALHGPGCPMDRATRSVMESRFGDDFSSVRIHTDSTASASAASIGALAYSRGEHVVFGGGSYAPGTPPGDLLLAHELAHVVQQRTGAPAMIQRQVLPGRFKEVPGSPVPLAGPYMGVNPSQTTPAPPETPAMLDKDLRSLIARATWPEIRKRIYPTSSAAGIQRAKDRKAGKLPDLTGLGSIASLEHFASAMHDVQKQWTKETTATPDTRVTWLGKTADDALAGAAVPILKGSKKTAMTARGAFSPAEWKFYVQEELVKQPTLPDGPAAEMANGTLHECRHAEQHYTGARYSAGFEGLDAAKIAQVQGIPDDIAATAVAHKMDAQTDPAVKSMGAQMAQSMGPDAATHHATDDAFDAEKAKLDTARSDADASATKLEAAAMPATIADAQAKRQTLRDEVSALEKRYAAYRAIPHEADAHEVGDAEEQAFKGWP